MNCKHNKPMMCMGVFDNTELWVGVECECAEEVDLIDDGLSYILKDSEGEGDDYTV